MSLYDLINYSVLGEKYIKEIGAKGYIIKHDKTGAQIIVMENDDTNKTFGIGFRTPPKDSTGLPHILEHSVLCGSKKFPVKEPFVELMKGSLNTFLNAMTFPDKTLYPVSSCNDKDFQNLVEVYLDAVFFPNIYSRKEIFMQEGWHYELDSLDGELTYNGVVYNEMKGAFSNPGQVLHREILHTMFKDNCYSVESGGNPDFITDLTYEDFLKFHSDYYHPSNSYIFLYGKANWEEKLNWIDSEYLSKFEKKDIDSKIFPQKDFKEMKHSLLEYPIGAEESTKDKSYTSVNYIIGNCQDAVLSNAFEILSYVLFDAPGAKVKQALIDAKLGTDISSSYREELLQPLFSIVAKGADVTKEQEFKNVIDETLKNILKEGLDKKAIFAAINYFEFKNREADFGGYSKGLIYGMTALSTWLYDGDPFVKLEVDPIFEKLKEYVETDYYEKLIKEYLLDNKNIGIVSVVPSNKLGEENTKKLKEKLAGIKNSLSKEEQEKVIEETKLLKEYQKAPSTPEELSTIPTLEREDLKTEITPLNNKEYFQDGIKVLNPNHNTNNIGYLTLLFDLERINEDDLPYVSLLTRFLGLLNTKNYSYQDIDVEINLNSGGLSFSSLTVDTPEHKLYLTCDASVLYDKIDFAFNMFSEIINNTLFEDKKRMTELLMILKARGQGSLVGSGHVYSFNRAASYISKVAYINDRISGIGFYKEIFDLVENLDENLDKIIEKLNYLKSKIFRQENLFICYVANDEGLNKMLPLVKGFKDTLSSEHYEFTGFSFQENKRNEGLKTSSNVQFVSRAGDYRKHGYQYTGQLAVLKNILNTDYLWVKGRVLGGAYGCMCILRKSGLFMFTSYRDPKLKETNQIYDEILDYLKNFKADEKEMTKYIIGAVGEAITPLSPRMKGSRSLSAYLLGTTEEELKLNFNQMVNCTEEDIKNLYNLVKDVLSDNALCVIGNETKIEENKDIFNEVYNLIK